MKSESGNGQPALQVVLLMAILFYLLLPNFGWAWHRVLPEHVHIFIGTGDHHALAPLPDCDAGAPDPNFIHLPSSSASLSAFAIVVCLFAIFVLPIPAEFSFRVRDLVFCMLAPILPPPDPPPTSR
jgi:hypothetical protein